MRFSRPHLPSFLAGGALCALTLVALAQKPATPVEWEYKVLTNPTEAQIVDVTGNGWEYVGFLGQSTRGPSMDQTLWRRPKK